MNPADISSLESADNHQHPNSQLIFGKITHHERKTSYKKSAANKGQSLHGGTASLPKESFVSKKISHVKKSSKNAVH